MRENALDTETTGLSVKNGDRVIEIACVEMENGVRTGRTYHQFINPERSIPMEAFAIHGIDDERVKNEPKFSQIVDEFLGFIKGSRLVIHNADFDVGHLDNELKIAGYPSLAELGIEVVDTLRMVREKEPNKQASLDAICKRHKIDTSDRTLHGALIDADLLAQAYLALIGRHYSLDLDTPVIDGVQDDSSEASDAPSNEAPQYFSDSRRPHRKPRNIGKASEEEVAVHQSFLEQKVTDPIWLRQDAG